MWRILSALTLAVGAVVVLAQPVFAHSLLHRHSAVSIHRHARLAYSGHYHYHRGWTAQPRAAAFRWSARRRFACPGCSPDPWASGYAAQSDFGSMSYRQAQVETQSSGPWAFGYAARRDFAPMTARRSQLEGMIAQEASANGVPESLVHRVIMRESGYNPRAVSSGNYGLMQIRLGTARAMGYGGSAAGLLDPTTNMTYAVRYLAGAYRAAGGNESRAVALYARGYNAPRVREASLQTWAPAAGGSFYAFADQGGQQWSADARVAAFNSAATPRVWRRHHSY
jgi:soluble lytic murein transglycosylase-like protein